MPLPAKIASFSPPVVKLATLLTQLSPDCREKGTAKYG
jgi:hypothetical protein